VIRSTDGAEYGLAGFAGSWLVQAFGPRDRVEIAIYQFKGERLQGTWVPPACAAVDLSPCGSEESRRVGADEFEIVKAHSIDGQPYSGRLKLTAAGQVVDGFQPLLLQWTLNDGVYHSFGIRTGDTMVSTFNFDGPTPHSISMLCRQPSGWAGVRLSTPGPADAIGPLQRESIVAV
jgi:hypothetical protein